MNDLILSIETSTEICSVAVGRGPELLHLETITEKFQHASMVTLLIDKCMQKLPPTIGLSNLSAIAVSEGPGSFTGLRVGLSAAKGLCFALDIPLIAVSTLKSIAAGARRHSETIQNYVYCSMIDARRMEVYCAFYDADLKEIVPPKAEILTELCFEEWLDRYQKLVFVGNGALKLKKLEAFENHEILDLACSADYLVQIAHEKNVCKEYSDVTNFSPKYLKSPNITKPRKVI